MTSFERGDVVIVDLGYAGKTRPCVVVSEHQPDSQRAMAVVVPLTREARGGECEVPFPKPAWLKQESVVNCVRIAGIDHARIERRLAPFPAAAFHQIEQVLRNMLMIGQ